MYDNAIENGAERVFKFAEAQAEHRQTSERMVIQADISNQQAGNRFRATGQWIAACMMLMAMAGAVFVGWLVPGASGATIAGFLLSGSVTTVVVSMMKKHDSRVDAE